MSCAIDPNAAPRIAKPRPSPRARRAAAATRAERRARAPRAPGPAAAAGCPRRGRGGAEARTAAHDQQRGEPRAAAPAATSARRRTRGSPGPSPAARTTPAQCGPASPIARSANDAAEHGDREPVRGPRGLDDLRGDGRDAREDQSHRRERRAERERAAERRARCAITREHDDHAQRDAGDAPPRQRGGERRVAADGARADQFRAPGLLLGARVARRRAGSLISPASASAIPPSRQATSPPTESA